MVCLAVCRQPEPRLVNFSHFRLQFVCYVFLLVMLDRDDAVQVGDFAAHQLLLLVLAVFVQCTFACWRSS